MSLKKVGLYTATSIVIANMVGYGVFTSLGYQAAGIHTGFAILMLWVIGGIAALCGALCYGEIGAMFPRSGGEYNYLSKIYHPSVGFVSGWVSSTVGFAAPVAAAAIALSEYLSNVFPTIDTKITASSVVIIITIIHTISLKVGSRFQNIFTTVKIIMMLFLIIAGLVAGRSGDLGFRPVADSWKDMTGAAFATSFFFVSLAYSGWNASGYIASDMENPQKNLPRSLFRGTMLVMVIYVLINFVFMYTTPLAQMSDTNGPVNDIAGVAAQNIFGVTGGKVMSLIISLLLISTISAMVFAGPRVTQMIGDDYKLFKIFARKNSNGIPAIAIITQCAISLFFIFTSTFRSVTIYISFTLCLFTFLTVLGLFIMRFREPNRERPYKTFGYPIIPIIFLLITGWLMYYGFTANTQESLWGLGTAISGLIFYFIDKGLNKKNENVILEK